jgi:ribose/xylose/arabinose/galactoside ABC-type transport system permease subunit
MTTQQVHSQLINAQKIVLFGVIAALVIALSIISPQFLQVRNFTNLFLQVAVIVIIASAANLLMITGNFDLSVGSVLAFSAILHAFLTKHGLPIAASVATVCVAAAVWGAINALTVGVLKITPVIATMGTMYAARGFAFLIARWDGGANISAGLPVDFTRFGRAMVFGQLPLVIILMVVAIAAFWFVEKKTVLGRFSFAIGGNRSAAALSGINVVGIISILYIIVGLLSGFSGVLQVSRVGAAFPNIAEGLEFDVIVAIVLGGTSMLGGEGSTFGMILGALIIGLAANGLNLLYVPFFYQEISKGLLLIVALFVDKVIRNRA